MNLKKLRRSSCPSGNLIAVYRGPSPKSDSSSEKSRRRSSLTSSSLAKPLRSMSSDDQSPVITGYGVGVPQMGTGGKNSSNSRRSSVNSQARIRVEKLEEALKHIGIDPTLDQQLELRTRLDVDPDGSVSYGEFVSVARELFRQELQDRNVQTLGTKAKQQRSDILRQQALQEVKMEEAARMRSERDRVVAELEEMRIQLREKDKHCNRLETDLLVLKTETKEALHENKSLKKKVHLSEQAQKAARSLEQDYEDVVKLLESENAQLRATLNKQGDTAETSKRIASLNAELRKSELGVKTYEVATEKLLHFANVVANNMGAPQSSNDNKMADTTSQTSTLNRKRHTPQAVAQEARDVIKLVKSLIERDPLPFGWQEVYTHDGNRYYVNEEKAELEMLEKAILAFEPSDEDVNMDTSSLSSPTLTMRTHHQSAKLYDDDDDDNMEELPDRNDNTSDTLRRNAEPKREDSLRSAEKKRLRRFSAKDDLRSEDLEEPPPDYTDTESGRFIVERF